MKLKAGLGSSYAIWPEYGLVGWLVESLTSHLTHYGHIGDGLPGQSLGRYNYNQIQLTQNT